MATIGIYVLKFLGTSKVYVGQSVNIEKRYTIHRRKLKDGTHNYKMLEAYKKFGMPELEIILECDKKDLNNCEAEAFEIYDAIHNGFNIATEPSIHLEGSSNGASKYSNEDIYKTMKYMLDITNSFKKISSITGVHESTIRHISNGDAHTWLEREYPGEYREMRSISDSDRKAYHSSAIGRGKSYPLVVSPTGETYNITNANAFAREHGLDSSYFIKVLNRRARSCKGWKLLNI